MPSPTFTQAEPRSLRVPILLAVLALIIAAALYSLHAQTGEVEITPVTTAVIATSTSFKSDSMVVGQDPQEIVLYVAPTLAVVNHRGMPVTLNEFSLTMTDTNGATLTARSMSSADITSVTQSFPQLRAALSGPLIRSEQELPAGATTHGTLLFSLRVTRAQWDARKSAILTTDIYNQPPVTVTLPH